MRSFARDLRRQLVASLQPKLAKENPLRTLGFSSELLRLGLSEDELYEHVRATARVLLSRVHPDRVGDREIEAQQRRVSEAFDLLKDRRLFSDWLRDFREEIDAERAETATLRQINKELQRVNAEHRGAAADAEGKIADLRQRYGALAHRLQTYLWMRTRVLGATHVFSAEQHLTLKVMRFSFYALEDCTPRKAAARRRLGEVLFALTDLSERGLARLPGAPDSAGLVFGLKSFRHLLATHRTPPVVGIKFEELTTQFGHYIELTRNPKGERIIFGSVLASDLATLQLDIAENTRIPYAALLSVLSGEIYPGVLLVTEDVQRRVPRGDDIASQLKSVRSNIMKRGNMAFVTDIVVDVRASDHP